MAQYVNLHLFFHQINEETGNRRPIMLSLPGKEEKPKAKEEKKEEAAKEEKAKNDKGKYIKVENETHLSGKVKRILHGNMFLWCIFRAVSLNK